MTVQSAANADQIAYWNAQAGQTWAAMQDKLDRQIEPLGLAAMAALDPSPGERILDIGCGCGQTTLELAERVGETGSVLAADISAPMLEIARRRAAEAGVSERVTFLEADAQTHPFPARKLDAAFSRFGVMFFEDPRAAFHNIASALVPGGRLAFVCWRSLQENPWMTTPFTAALPLIPSPPPPPADPHAPGPFAFADADRLRTILMGAGFGDIDIAPHDQQIGGNDLETSVGLSLRVGPLGAVLREQPHLKDSVTDAVRQALKPFVTDRGVMQPSATWIVSARRA
ncbi:MAG: class I SAM-dependent methyltransferase [Phenylobacterium sp.]|uniref:class I SAM-dependent methyltransferase n=1 Tax=Phenylobacterium sp. TaxID=1871053 RepID=UPI00391C2504